MLICIYIAGYSQMSTHVPGFQHYYHFLLHHYVLAKVATSSIRVNTGKAYSAVPHYENNSNYLHVTHHWLVEEDLRLCAQSRPLLIVFTNVWWGSLVTEYNGIYKQKGQFKSIPIWLFNSSRFTYLRISYRERVIKIHASNIINSEDTTMLLT